MLPRLHRHPWMDDDIQAFRVLVRKFIEAEYVPHLDSWRRQGFIPRETWRGLAQLGALLPEIDERFGGAGASLAYQLVLTDELARAEMPGSAGIQSIVAHYIAEYGTEEQRARWLPRMVAGELFAGIAMTEPGCGSDLKAMTTRARREGHEYVIDGAKTLITNAFSGNLLVVAARTGDGGGGISLLVVETEGLPGFGLGRRLEKIGLHAMDTSELFFDGVRVPAGNLIGGEEGRGFGQLMGQLPFERILIAVEAAACIERAVELTVAYVGERRLFGKRLAELQNTRFKLAECATAAHIVRSFVNDCTQRLLDGTLDCEAAYMAKWWCTEQRCRVIDECLQLFGGYGFLAEYPIGRMYADARLSRIAGGTTEVMKDLIARRLLG
ncbi:MAG: acyl-CoA dehydrogenase [Gammaproteobacteria bacterium]|nr:MAG: acyl-CoA dehydrogenase [Gammaproteobacteria bacterium]